MVGQEGIYSMMRIEKLRRGGIILKLDTLRLENPRKKVFLMMPRNDELPILKQF